MIKIESNGSKWAGEEPDTIDVLLDVLKHYPLDKHFEEYGNFVIKAPGKPNKLVIRFFGNFFNLSHVFEIETDDSNVIKLLTDAIRDNQKRADYQAQD